MSETNGQRTIEVVPEVVTALLPAGMRRNLIEGVMVVPTTQGGLQLPRRMMPVQIGAPIAWVIQQFLVMCQNGQIRRKVKGEDGQPVKDLEGNPVLERIEVRGVLDDLVVGPPMPAALPEPPKRIITEG